MTTETEEAAPQEQKYDRFERLHPTDGWKTVQRDSLVVGDVVRRNGPSGPEDPMQVAASTAPGRISLRGYKQPQPDGE